MPCTDGGIPYDGVGPSDWDRNKERDRINRLAKVEAMLCAALHFIAEDKGTGDPTDFLDHKEAGVSNIDMQIWWNNHLTQDAMRRKKEAEAAERLKAIAAAKAKLADANLTETELKLLGIK